MILRGVFIFSRALILSGVFVFSRALILSIDTSIGFLEIFNYNNYLFYQKKLLVPNLIGL